MRHDVVWWWCCVVVHACMCSRDDCPQCPDADLVAMDALRVVLRPGGTLVVSVPVGPVDVLVWNLHRIYGPVRLPLLLEGWGGGAAAAANAMVAVGAPPPADQPLPRRYLTSTPDRVFTLVNDAPLAPEVVEVRGEGATSWRKVLQMWLYCLAAACALRGRRSTLTVACGSLCIPVNVNVRVLCVRMCAGGVSGNPGADAPVP
jgi:hypothetical protein